MKIEQLSNHDDNSIITADLVIVGGGPTGLTIAAQCAKAGRKVLIVESGLELENSEHSALNEVESVGQPHSEAQCRKRIEFHSPQARFWSQEVQPFGVRCRALGGSTHAWAGKSAPFSSIDFKARSWVSHSGWPVDREQIDPYILRAMEVLNLSPQEPPGRFDQEGLHSFYWQFARSRVDRLDVMRFGSEFMAQRSDNIDVLLDATVTHVGLSPDGSRFSDLEVASMDGKRARIEASMCVLAASGIENARLLLVSNDVHFNGIGNHHDVVGRYLMDHPGARIGAIPTDQMAVLTKLFGFFGIHHHGRAHMFMHGLALTPEIQEREELLNAAVYFATERAPDDPWDALKRLLRRHSPDVGRDLRSVAAGSGLIVKGLGMRVLSDSRTPKALKDIVVNSAIRMSPNLVANEFQNQGVPHKLVGLRIEAISEQIPNPESRISLSSRKDRFGVPLAKVAWRINDAERQTLLRIAELSRKALTSAGLPAPVLEDWARERRPEDIVIIDMAHTLGTTRMSADAKTGVVDENCMVHGVSNLYVAGGSVFPTSGHANPTLMILAFAIRLADHLNSNLAKV
ncbi:GMC family oxidoreductase [Rhizobium sp. NXC24]|uniref:GMC oxidoreductase n=1 Tax=Rhizobium sp. NXC24 TaxID=2048897 RepID=UPI000CDF44C2|nr:GMC family oxidoreductase [Rhizobium sp. NXC24]AVA25894.1 glucose-methanol-choline oxidoreductase protein [Rhizobium sp. NXC24]